MTQKHHSLAYTWIKTRLEKIHALQYLFIAALFIVTMIWIQAKFPSTEQGINKMEDVEYIYNVMLLSH